MADVRELPTYHLTGETDYIYLSFADKWKKSRIVWDTVKEEDVPQRFKDREAARLLKYS